MPTKKTAIKSITDKLLPLRGADIDTDRIIPARYMKVVTFEGLGTYVFNDVRHASDGTLLEHPFNNTVFAQHGILVVNRNFGCGSSREHAPQALRDWGIKAILGESFAEIFAGNCNALGIPTMILSAADVIRIQDIAEQSPESEATIDLQNMTVRVGTRLFNGTMPESSRNALLQGSWDSTAVLLEGLDEIEKTYLKLPYAHRFHA